MHPDLRREVGIPLGWRWSGGESNCAKSHGGNLACLIALVGALFPGWLEGCERRP